MDQHEEIEAVEPDASAEQVDPRDEKIANLEAQLAEAQTRERDGILRVKAEMENLRRRTELDIEKAHKFALEIHQRIAAVIDSWIVRWKWLIKLTRICPRWLKVLS